MKLEFKAEDFADLETIGERGFMYTVDLDCQDQAALIANARLAEMLAEAPVVEGEKYADTDNCRMGWWVKDTCALIQPTHRARLVQIERLEKK